MRVRYRKGIATHSDPESCGVRREVQAEALAGETAGQPLSREIINPGRRRCLNNRKAI
jgi:RNA-directed DNA polymerase